MEILTGLGWMFLVATGAVTVQNNHKLDNALNNYNNKFAMDVDRGDSCFDRVSGIEGSYGGPHEFSMDLLCNYRLHKEPVAMDEPQYKWTIKRKG
jgi:hypothetical protein